MKRKLEFKEGMLDGPGTTEPPYPGPAGPPPAPRRLSTDEIERMVRRIVRGDENHESKQKS